MNWYFLSSLQKKINEWHNRSFCYVPYGEKAPLIDRTIHRCLRPVYKALLVRLIKKNLIK
jgi:hypothetical protein